LTYQDTSRKAYQEVREESEETQEANIARLLALEGPLSHRQVSNILRIEIRTISARMAGMRRKGMIREAGTRTENGHDVLTWELGKPDPDGRPFGLYFPPGRWRLMVAALRRIGTGEALEMAQKIQNRLNEMEGKRR
jgi:predicted ArsR family transcriptional regulator